MSDLWPVCLPVCLSNSLSLTCFTCLFASCCFSPALPLPVFSLRGQTAEMKSPGNSAAHVATQEDAHSHKTEYSRYQTANISIQTRHSPTPPITPSSRQSVSNKLFSLGKSCKREKLKTSLGDRGCSCFRP